VDILLFQKADIHSIQEIRERGRGREDNGLLVKKQWWWSKIAMLIALKVALKRCTGQKITNQGIILKTIPGKPLL